MRTYTMTWKIYGLDGHRQRMSFFPSVVYDWSTEVKTRIVSILSYDFTNSNEYVIFRITRDTKQECINELNGQLSDGLFEDSRVGKVEEINNEKMRKLTMKKFKITYLINFTRRLEVCIHAKDYTQAYINAYKSGNEIIIEKIEEI